MRGGVPTTTMVARRGVVPRAAWRETPVLQVLTRGLLAGVAGVAAMTLAEKVEQAFTGRLSSFVPAHTLERLPDRPDRERIGLNWAMHWGRGVLLGALRAWMARRGAASAARLGRVGSGCSSSLMCGF